MFCKLVLYSLCGGLLGGGLLGRVDVRREEIARGQTVLGGGGLEGRTCGEKSKGELVRADVRGKVAKGREIA